LRRKGEAVRRRGSEDGRGRARRRGHFLQSRWPSWYVPKVMAVRRERMEEEKPSDGCARTKTREEGIRNR
jgi:hypothetical protein